MLKAPMRSVYTALAFLLFAGVGHASQCLVVPPGAGCNVPGSENTCTFAPSAGTMVDCATICPAGDAGCYYKSPSDVGNTCSPAISCFSTLSCNCLPGGSCQADSQCTGQNQVCNTATGQCIAKPASVEFQKHGNNGTVSCGTFCAGPQWGQVGSCSGTQLANVPCGQTVGFLNGPENQCWCSDPSGAVFLKDGNNGTVSCSTFCAGSQWGRTGTCTYSAVPKISDCSFTPGFIQNAAEMTCYCK